MGFCAGCGGFTAGQEHADILGRFDDVLDYDTPPALVRAVRPEYPEIAREVGAEGRVVLKALILEDGKLGGVEIVESPNPILAHEAISALRRSVFSPAMKAGEPCCGTVMIPFIFGRDDSWANERLWIEVDHTGAPQEDSLVPPELPEGPQEGLKPGK
jgi:TonB family protein